MSAFDRPEVAIDCPLAVQGAIDEHVNLLAWWHGGLRYGSVSGQVAQAQIA